MNKDELKQILELNGEERYDYFLSRVGEDRDIWILVNSESRFLKIESDDGDVAHLPVWPGQEFAAEYAERTGDLMPKSISLPDFFRKWVPGLTKDGLEVGVFPGLDDTLWVTDPEELKRDLQDEL